MKAIYILLLLLVTFGITGCAKTQLQDVVSYTDRTTTIVTEYPNGTTVTQTPANPVPQPLPPTPESKPVKVTTTIKESIQTVSKTTDAQSYFVWSPNYPTHGSSTIDKKKIASGETDWVGAIIQHISSIYILFWIGGIAVIGGLVLAFVFNFKTAGIVISIGGGLLIGIGVLFEQYPWVALAIPVLVVGGIVWWIIAAKKAKEAKEKAELDNKSLKQTIEGVQLLKEGIPDEEAKDINLELKSKQDKDVQDYIKEIKVEEGLKGI